jgi:RNA polymerase sigma-70 factor (ECF subfamily)
LDGDSKGSPPEETGVEDRIAPLLEPARRGSEEAWKELVELLFPTVAKVVRNHLPNTELEEDLIQDVFVKVFMKLEQFAGDRPLTHWVSKIALNTCYDRLRSQKARRVQSFTTLAIEEREFLAVRSDDDPHEAAHRSREATEELLNELIATLNPEQQIVIRLIDLEEKSVAEACELTGWGASKVKVTAMRARRKLTESLQAMEAASQQRLPNRD